MPESHLALCNHTQARGIIIVYYMVVLKGVEDMPNNAILTRSTNQPVHSCIPGND